MLALPVPWIADPFAFCQSSITAKGAFREWPSRRLDAGSISKDRTIRKACIFPIGKAFQANWKCSRSARGEGVARVVWIPCRNP